MMNTYFNINYIQVGCTALLFCGSVIPGVWALGDLPPLHHCLVPVLQHGVGTVLLASALLMLTDIVAVAVTGQRWPLG